MKPEEVAKVNGNGNGHKEAEKIEKKSASSADRDEKKEPVEKILAKTTAK